MSATATAAPASASVAAMPAPIPAPAPVTMATLPVSSRSLPPISIQLLEGAQAPVEGHGAVRDQARLQNLDQLELLPLHTALAGMHVVIVLLRFVTPMALAVVGDLLLHAAPCPGLVGFHLHAPVGHRLWLHARHCSYPPGGDKGSGGPAPFGHVRW